MRMILGVVAAALIAVPAFAGGNKTEETNLATVTTVTETIWNGRDTSVVAGAFSAELAAPTKEFADTILALYPDGRLTIVDSFAKGDRVVTQWTYEGTHAALGKHARVTGLSVDTVADGIIVGSVTEWDQLPLFTQLGVDPFEATADANLVTAKTYAELAYNTVDLDGAFALVVPGGFVEVDNGSQAQFHSREFHETSLATWKDGHLTLGSAFARGDHVVATWTYAATHAETGKPVTFGGTWLARFEGGKIAEVWNAYDTAPITAALAPEAPATAEP